MSLNQKASVGSNVSEIIHSYKRKGTIGTSTPKNAGKARQQALAIAFSLKRKKGVK